MADQKHVEGQSPSIANNAPTTASKSATVANDVEEAVADANPAGAVADPSVLGSKEAKDGEGVSSLNSGSEGTAAEPSKDGEEAAAAPENQRSKGKTALIVFGLMMAAFLSALDLTIVTTALPVIASAFNATSSEYTWVGSSYLLAAAASTPTWGKISDIFGRKPTILVCNALFLIGSLVCALSITINMLIGGRIIQGTGAGGLIALTQICISDLFSMRQRGLYFGLIGLVWAFASAIGPLLGGVFSEFVTWRWCFYINLPCDGLAFILLLLFLDIKTPKTPFVAGIKAIDWLGSLAVIGGVVMLLLGLEFGGITFPWDSATVICLIVFGVVTIGIFFAIEKYVAKYPIIPTRIFSSANNLGALLTCFLHAVVYISGAYFLPVYFQSVLGASPLLSGVYTLPFALSLSFTSAGSGIVIKKTGNYVYIIWVGLVILTLGMGLFIDMMRPYASWPRIIIYQLIAGFGVGAMFQAPLIALQNGCHPKDIASATSTFAFARQMGTSTSVTIGGVIFQNQVAKYIGRSGLPQDLRDRVASTSAGASIGLVKSLPASQHLQAISSYSLGLRDMWIFYAVAAFVGLLVSLMIRQKDLSKSHEETKTGLEEQEKHRQEMKKAEKARRAEKKGRAGGVEGGVGNGVVATEEEAKA